MPVFGDTVVRDAKLKKNAPPKRKSRGRKQDKPLSKLILDFSLAKGQECG
jgi:hypothetical protein